jgi:hypothetical protein
MSKLLALAAVFTTFAFAQNQIIILPGANPPSTPQSSSFSFPLVGLASSESIEVNLINLAANSTNTSTSGSTGGTAASCTGNVTFQTASSGTDIGGATNFTLAADAVASITPSVSSTVTTSGGRVLIRAIVTTTFTAGVPCSLASTLNTFDTATGVTHVFLVGQATPVAVPVFTIPGH